MKLLSSILILASFHYKKKIFFLFQPKRFSAVGEDFQLSVHCLDSSLAEVHNEHWVIFFDNSGTDLRMKLPADELYFLHNKKASCETAEIKSTYTKDNCALNLRILPTKTCLIEQNAMKMRANNKWSYMKFVSKNSLVVLRSRLQGLNTL